ncbi:zinc finger protein 346 isoform X2 [Silurus meridionalis]|uniref:zinc finger protein 346 isoform X2 n=1 Tax=Silurus meridionalis TaxID=175797 RepID=UPI001EECC9DD|nr:zinc finger protein 346 isoform X2 [Silurus meridionalis]
MATRGPNGDLPFLPSGAAEVNRMIQENGDLFSESQCRVCNAVLISESQKLAHYQSKKHASKVRRYMATHEDEPFAKRFKSSSHDAESGEVLQSDGDKYKSCLVCNMNFSSAVVAQSHYQGKVHAKNIRLKSFGVQAPVASIPQPTVKVKKLDVQSNEGKGPAASDPNRFCNICQASFNNPVMAQQHYSGKKHKKHLTKQKLMETFGPSTTPASTVKGYPCTMCNIELNSVEQYQAHISGAKHKNHIRLKEGGNSTVSPLGKKKPDYVYGYNQQQQVQEDWGSLKQDYESGGL